MNQLHKAYLSLGSNIEPELNIPRAIQSLREYGKVEALSTVWESHAVGSDGPDFLNVCLLFLTNRRPYELKEQIIRPIEAALGRIRFADRNAPRTIDIDMVLFDGKPLNVEFWEYAFVIVPLAELIPDFIHPTRRETLARVAKQLQGLVWIVPRADVLIS